MRRHAQWKSRNNCQFSIFNSQLTIVTALGEEVLYRIGQALGPDILGFIADTAARRFQIQTFAVARFAGGKEGDAFAGGWCVRFDTTFVEAVRIMVTQENVGADFAFE